MTTLWARIRLLEGQTLLTADHQKPFTIVEVTSDRIWFVPKNGMGSRRSWPRRDMEDVNEKYADVKIITPKMIRDYNPQNQNTSYVPAILNAVKRADVELG